MKRGITIQFLGDMNVKWIMWALLLASCAHTTPPEHMKSADGVRIIMSDSGRSCVLSTEEAIALLKEFNTRLFTNGRQIAEAEQWKKHHVLTVAYPYAQSTVIVSEASHSELNRVNTGAGETHIQVYSDGTVGYMRTMLTYVVYPMEAYCTAAIRLAEKHGLMSGRANGAN